MKISYQHIINFIDKNPSIEDISDKLFQLGHEHDIYDEIFDIEITPNRGDCLSLQGILRELSVFYDINFNVELYDKDINSFDFPFKNLSKHICPRISFLKVVIDKSIKPYSGMFGSYFDDMDNNKNNFFTDISNYVSYELGQPTHCYDFNSLKDVLIFDALNEKKEFQSLTNQKLILNPGDSVFKINNDIVNLAGVMGGKSTACNLNTTSAIVECAFFEPEYIIGKTIKYDINSDAAYKFERGVDPNSHLKTLRRFIQLVNEHALIKSVEIFSFNELENLDRKITFDLNAINHVLGTEISEDEYKNILIKLGFKIENEFVIVPSFRNDIETQNDLSEEVARVLGFDKIKSSSIDLPNVKMLDNNLSEKLFNEYLIDNGFYEVINFPFISESKTKSIKLDNPLDVNKSFLRTNLKESLINNLLYNERRQNDSIKLFEISNVYNNTKEGVKSRRKLGIIATGRVGKNYKEFTNKINKNYFENVLSFIDNPKKITIEVIPRRDLDSKIKNEIIYAELDLEEYQYQNISYVRKSNKPKNFVTYKPISEFPSSYRDISFSVTNFRQIEELEDIILNYGNDILKEIYVFDFFKNEKINEIKIGFRFIFQSHTKTLEEKEINNVVNDIIAKSTNLEGVYIPGL